MPVDADLHLLLNQLLSLPEKREINQPPVKGLEPDFRKQGIDISLIQSSVGKYYLQGLNSFGMRERNRVLLSPGNLFFTLIAFLRNCKLPGQV